MLSPPQLLTMSQTSNASSLSPKSALTIDAMNRLSQMILWTRTSVEKASTTLAKPGQPTVPTTDAQPTGPTMNAQPTGPTTPGQPAGPTTDTQPATPGQSPALATPSQSTMPGRSAAPAMLPLITTPAALAQFNYPPGPKDKQSTSSEDNISEVEGARLLATLKETLALIDHLSSAPALEQQKVRVQNPLVFPTLVHDHHLNLTSAYN